MKPNLLTYRSKLALSITALAVGLTSTMTQAQIEEIVVTAEKRSENIQDIGLSVQAFTEKGLELGGIDDVSRLDLLVSGVNFAFAGNDAKFNVRGANSSNTFGDNSSIVGAFVDGVYKTRASQQSRAFFDVERVEFLKGPQGTLYGRNTFAGALNVYTKKPDLEAFGADISFGYERFDRQTLEYAINLPVNDNFGLRVAGFNDKSDGYITNLAGPDIGAQDDKGVRLSAFWQVNDKVDVIARYSHIEEDGREAGLFGYTFLCRNETPEGLTDPFGSVSNCENPVRGSGGLATAANDPNGGDPYTIAQDFVPPVDLSEDVVSVEVNADLGSVALKSITSYTDYINNIGFDFDFSPTRNSNGGFDESTEAFTQEFQFSSTGDGPLQWTAGLYYSNEETFYSFTIYQQTLRDDSVRASTTFTDPVTGVTQSFTILSGTPIVSNDIVLGGFYADSTFVDSRALGIYAQAEYSINESLRLIGGLRYNDEDKNLFGGGSNFTGDTNGDDTTDRVVNVVPGAAGSSPVIIPLGPEVFTINPNASDAITQNPDNYSNVSWRAGVEYDVNDESLLYLTAATGFLSGALSTGSLPTDEQESRVIELGYKSYLLEDTLKLNAALHFTEYTNLLAQLQRSEGGIVITESINGGEIEAFGLEVEAVYVPSDEWTLSANLAFLDSEYTRFGVANPYQLFNGRVQSFIDLNGETTPWSPDFTLTLSASYDYDMGEYGTLTPHLQFFSSSEFGTSNLYGPDPSQIQDSYTKTDVRLIWNSADDKYSAELYIENIEDEAVLTRGNNNSDDIVQTSFLYPQNYGIKFSVSF